VQNCFCQKLRQISTNFDNFWQKDGKEAEIMQGALIFHLVREFKVPYVQLKIDRT